jgi:hypothetical protein
MHSPSGRGRPVRNPPAAVTLARIAGGNVSKKKNKTETMNSAPVGEALPPGPTEQPTEWPAPEPPPASPSAAPNLAPAVPEAPPDLVDPGPQPAPADPPSIDLVTVNAPVAQPAPLATLAPHQDIGPLLERIRRLEETLTEVQNLPAIEQRVADRVATQLQREKPAPPEEPHGLSSAGAILDAGKQLLPTFVLPPALPVASPPPHASTAAQRMWLLADVVAEARVIVRMYVDPRYALSWMGRTVPLVLLVAFATAQWWVPFGSLPGVGWIPVKVAELLTGFLLFKVLGHEARRYRQTAPDLPPSLRL